MRYEEDVEEGERRWSKPHVSTLSLHMLFELRGVLANAALLMDNEAKTFEQVAGKRVRVFVEIL